MTLKSLFAGTLFLLACGLSGCGTRTPVMSPAPMAPPVSMQQASGPTGQNVYDWTSVPAGQRIPVERAVFDQGGYQIYTQDGTIVVPFANENLYVMKFGRSPDGQTYFVNEGEAPTLYVANGFGLQNAAAQGALWYPLPQSYAYTQPVYVGLAPSWSAFTTMGWYPGMTYYGGLSTPYYHPGMIGTWMPGFMINIGGRPYNSYTTYTNYYQSRGGYVRPRIANNVYTQPRASNFGSNRTAARRGYSNGGTGTGSFQRRSTSGNSGVGAAPRTYPTRPRSSFGGSSGYSNTPRSGGGSFGSSAPRSSGSSGGSYGRSSGGGSFGRSSGGGSFGRSSGGGSFGGGRRR